MDVELLSKLIRDILLEEDQVTLPGLGTLVAEVVPASFSDRGYTINPPYRRLSFIPTAGEDRLLAMRWAVHSGEKLAQAEQNLARFMAQLKEVLKQRKSVVLPGLGKLRATRENHFFFVPDQQMDIYPEGFGLESISLKNHEETAEEIADAVSDLAEAMADTPVPEPVVETVPEPEVEEPVNEPAKEVVEKKKKKHPLLTTLLIAAVLCIVFLGALAILGRTNPDFVDRFLYSPEQLQTIQSLKL